MTNLAWSTAASKIRCRPGATPRSGFGEPWRPGFSRPHHGQHRGASRFRSKGSAARGRPDGLIRERTVASLGKVLAASARSKTAEIPTQICVLGPSPPRSRPPSRGAADLIFNHRGGQKEHGLQFDADTVIEPEAAAAQGTSTGRICCILLETRQGSELSSGAHYGATR